MIANSSVFDRLSFLTTAAEVVSLNDRFTPTSLSPSSNSSSPTVMPTSSSYEAIVDMLSERKRPRMVRRRIAPQDAALLQAMFAAGHHFPTRQEREQLAQQLGLTPRTIQVWFQNRRQSSRNRQRQAGEKAGRLVPPPPRSQAELPIVDETPVPHSPLLLLPSSLKATLLASSSANSTAAASHLAATTTRTPPPIRWMQPIVIDSQTGMPRAMGKINYGARDVQRHDFPFNGQGVVKRSIPLSRQELLSRPVDSAAERMRSMMMQIKNRYPPKPIKVTEASTTTTTTTTTKLPSIHTLLPSPRRPSIC